MTSSDGEQEAFPGAEKPKSHHKARKPCTWKTDTHQWEDTTQLRVTATWGEQTLENQQINIISSTTTSASKLPQIGLAKTVKFDRRRMKAHHLSSPQLYSVREHEDFSAHTNTPARAQAFCSFMDLSADKPAVRKSLRSITYLLALAAVGFHGVSALRSHNAT